MILVVLDIEFNENKIVEDLGEQSLEASCLCQLYFKRIQRTCPSFGRFYVC